MIFWFCSFQTSNKWNFNEKDSLLFSCSMIPSKSNYMFEASIAENHFCLKAYCVKYIKKQCFFWSVCSYLRNGSGFYLLAIVKKLSISVRIFSFTVRKRKFTDQVKSHFLTSFREWQQDPNITKISAWRLSGFFIVNIWAKL